MKEVAVFKKVSKAQFGETYRNMYPTFDFTTKIMDDMYESIRIPKRATAGSAGYDFVTPFPFVLYPGTKIWIPTGIRVEMKDSSYALLLVPRSKFAKHSIRIANTIGVVDGDYYYADNEGHIIIVLEMSDCSKSPDVKSCFGNLTKNVTEPAVFHAGDRIGQGIFVEFGICFGDSNREDIPKRAGGFGSTGK